MRAWCFTLSNALLRSTKTKPVAFPQSLSSSKRFTINARASSVWVVGVVGKLDFRKKTVAGQESFELRRHNFLKKLAHDGKERNWSIVAGCFPISGLVYRGNVCLFERLWQFSCSEWGNGSCCKGWCQVRGTFLKQKARNSSSGFAGVDVL